MPQYKGRKKIGEILIAMGRVSEMAIHNILQEQQKTKAEKGYQIRIGDLLLKKKLVSEHDLAEAVAVQYNTDYIDLRGVQVAPELLERVPLNLLADYNFVPIKLEAKRLTIASEDDIPEELFGKLFSLFRVEIRFVSATRSQIAQAKAAGVEAIQAIESTGKRETLHLSSVLGAAPADGALSGGDDTPALQEPPFAATQGAPPAAAGGLPEVPLAPQANPGPTLSPEQPPAQAPGAFDMSAASPAFQSGGAEEQPTSGRPGAQLAPQAAPQPHAQEQPTEGGAAWAAAQPLQPQSGGGPVFSPDGTPSFQPPPASQPPPAAPPGNLVSDGLQFESGDALSGFAPPAGQPAAAPTPSSAPPEPETVAPGRPVYEDWQGQPGPAPGQPAPGQPAPGQPAAQPGFQPAPMQPGPQQPPAQPAPQQPAPQQPPAQPAPQAQPQYQQPPSQPAPPQSQPLPAPQQPAPHQPPAQPAPQAPPQYQQPPAQPAPQQPPAQPQYQQPPAQPAAQPPYQPPPSQPAPQPPPAHAAPQQPAPQPAAPPTPQPDFDPLAAAPPGISGDIPPRNVPSGRLDPNHLPAELTESLLWAMQESWTTLTFLPDGGKAQIVGRRGTRQAVLADLDGPTYGRLIQTLSQLLEFNPAALNHPVRKVFECQLSAEEEVGNFAFTVTPSRPPLVQVILKTEPWTRGLGAIGYPPGVPKPGPLLAGGQGLVILAAPDMDALRPVYEATLAEAGFSDAVGLALERRPGGRVPGVLRIQAGVDKKTDCPALSPSALADFVEGGNRLLSVDHEPSPGDLKRLVHLALTETAVLVPTTANDALNAFMRVKSCGVSTSALVEATRLILVAHPVGRICPYCKETYLVTEEMLPEEQRKALANIKVYRGKGCGGCEGSGIQGITYLFETLELPPGRVDVDRLTREKKPLRNFLLEEELLIPLQKHSRKALMWGLVGIEDYLARCKKT